MSAAGPSSSFSCPGCGGPLGPREVRGVGLQSCESCNGLLLTPPTLTPLLEALSDDLLKSFDPDAKLQAIGQQAKASDCPSCHKPMESADYCGAKLAFFERCNRCAQIWLSGEALGAMTLMWARMEKRIARTKAQNAEDLSVMDSMAQAAHLRRVVDNAILKKLL